MNENLNLVEILKDCPKWTKLYSSVFGMVELDHINIRTNYPIVIKLKGTEGYESLTSEGKMFVDYDGECVLFPSKEQRDWSKFNPKNEELVPPCEFKDGDILSYQNKYLNNRTIYIYRYHKTNNTAFYVALGGNENETFYIDSKGECALNGYDHTVRFATEEEKQKLFDAIKEKGYKWNAETKTLEKLVEPKFKVGDWLCANELNNYANNIKIVNIVDVFGKKRYKISRDYDSDLDLVEFNFIEKHYHLWTIQDAKDGDVIFYDEGWICIFKCIHGIWYSSYCFITDDGEFHTGYESHAVYSTIHGNAHPATKEQRNALMKAINDAGYKWNIETKTLEKLVESKFDPKTLQPFDKVLVRDRNTSYWRCSFFSHKNKDTEPNTYKYATLYNSYRYCIPYNDDTKHLVGTAEEAPEFYRYWED